MFIVEQRYEKEGLEYDKYLGTKIIPYTEKSSPNREDLESYIKGEIIIKFSKPNIKTRYNNEEGYWFGHSDDGKVKHIYFIADEKWIKDHPELNLKV